MKANIFLALRDDADSQVRIYLSDTDDEYTGPVPLRAGRVFRYFEDEAVVRNLWPTVNVSGNDYHLYSISFSNEDYTFGQIRDEIDWLLATYGGQIFVLGAWRWDGEQFQDAQGDPIYPIHPRLIDFMPPIWNQDDPPTYTPATELTDVNLLAGQSPRNFS